MKRLIFAAIVATSFPVLAIDQPASQPLAVMFQELPLSQFLNFYFKHHLKQNFVLSKELVNNTTPVTLNLRNVPADQYSTIFANVFKSYGVSARLENGVWFVSQVQSQRGLPPGLSADPAALLQGPLTPSLDAAMPASISSQDQPSTSLPATSSPGSVPSPVINAPPVLPIDQAVSVYFPRERSADYLQILANKLLATDFPPSESVFLRGAEKSVARAMAILESVDVAPATVKVTAHLLEFTDTKDEGRSFSVALSILGGKAGLVFGAAQGLQNAVTFKNKSIDLVLSALDGDSRFKLVDSPSTLCDHGESCRVQAGMETPVLSSTTIDRDGVPQQQIVYRDSGSILEFTPTVQRDFVRLNLKQTVSSFTKNQLSGIDSPALLKRLLESRLTVREGETIILGGLDQDRSTTSRSGLPFVPAVFDSTSSQVTKTQLLMLLQVERVRVQDGPNKIDFPAIDHKQIDLPRENT